MLISYSMSCRYNTLKNIQMINVLCKPTCWINKSSKNCTNVQSYLNQPAETWKTENLPERVKKWRNKNDVFIKAGATVSRICEDTRTVIRNEDGENFTLRSAYFQHGSSLSKIEKSKNTDNLQLFKDWCVFIKKQGPWSLGTQKSQDHTSTLKCYIT